MQFLCIFLFIKLLAAQSPGVHTQNNKNAKEDVQKKNKGKWT